MIISLSSPRPAEAWRPGAEAAPPSGHLASQELQHGLCASQLGLVCLSIHAAHSLCVQWSSSFLDAELQGYSGRSLLKPHAVTVMFLSLLKITCLMHLSITPFLFHRRTTLLFCIHPAVFPFLQFPANVLPH